MRAQPLVHDAVCDDCAEFSCEDSSNAVFETTALSMLVVKEDGSGSFRPYVTTVVCQKSGQIIDFHLHDKAMSHQIC